MFATLSLRLVRLCERIKNNKINDDELFVFALLVCTQSIHVDSCKRTLCTPLDLL